MSQISKLKARRDEIESRFDNGEITPEICKWLIEIDRKIFELLKSK